MNKTGKDAINEFLSSCSSCECNCNKNNRMIIDYSCGCNSCNMDYTIDMGCTDIEYSNFIDTKMKLWNTKNIKNKKNIMTYDNTIITPIRPYESFINDAKYNLTMTDDGFIFDDNLKNMLKDYYHYTNFQPYFFYLDEHTEYLAKQTYINTDKYVKYKKYFGKYNRNKWNDNDTEYWLKNIFMNKEFYDIYTNI